MCLKATSRRISQAARTAIKPPSFDGVALLKKKEREEKIAGLPGDEQIGRPRVPVAARLFAIFASDSPGCESHGLRLLLEASGVIPSAFSSHFFVPSPTGERLSLKSQKRGIAQVLERTARAAAFSWRSD